MVAPLAGWTWQSVFAASITSTLPAELVDEDIEVILTIAVDTRDWCSGRKNRTSDRPDYGLSR